MQRYFINEVNIDKEIILIDEDDSHHIKTVMRMRQGDQVLCTVNSKHSYLCEILTLEKQVKLKILKEIFEQTELNINICIAHGVISREKTEDVVKKLSELGVKKYIPIHMKRSKYKLDNNKSSRFNRIIKEACEQAQRSSLLIFDEIREFIYLEELAKNYSEKYFANVGAKEDIYTNKFSENVKDILFVVGPEGGFDANERDNLLKWGYKELGLGARIMRTETAPIFIASVSAYIYGEKNEN